MNFKINESVQKLNGSYYTPYWLSDFISHWVVDSGARNILEPSCGDGVFIQSLSKFSNNELHVQAFDIDINAINSCYNKCPIPNIHLNLRNEDFIGWALNNLKSNNPIYFDAVVGNPPFIRYQYLEKSIQQKSQELFEYLGMKFSKHTNAWVPFIIASISLLHPGGKLGMIIPSEILHVLYAKGLRKYLIEQCHKIMLIDSQDIWFEDTLQGAMILLIEKKDNNNFSGLSLQQVNDNFFSENNPVVFFENAKYETGDYLENKWTYALLTPLERETFSKIIQSPKFYKFKDLAKVDVGIVTGANNFFLVNNQVVKEYHLQDVSHPMFGRSNHCPGIIYNQQQQQANEEKGYPTNFLYFENENIGKKHVDYIKFGEEQQLHTRFKCRIRKPWYKVPSIYATPICMLKRSNGMPRLILNELMAYTTDTAYRINPMPEIESESLVRCFLNSITALSAELEGRHYGGGVLELVPSEIEKLVVPYTNQNFIDIHTLNDYVKEHTVNQILSMQDELLFNILDIPFEQIKIIQEALCRLQSRRQRNPN